MKKILIMSMMLMLCIGFLLAQTIADYTYSTVTNGSLIDMSSGTTDIFATGTYRDDVASTVMNIGFSFTLGTVAHTQFSINSNGQIQLGATVISGTNSTPALNIAKIAPISGDNALPIDGKAHYKVLGTAPDRILVIEWNQLRIHYGDPSTPPYCTIQALLYETSNRIEFIYGQMYNTYTSAKSLGIFISTSNTAGTIGQLTTISESPTWNVTATSVTTTSFPASSYLTNLNSSANGNRRVFSFTPPDPLAPPNKVISPNPANNAMSVGLTPTLSWASGGNLPTHYNVYLDTVNPPLQMVSNQQTTLSYVVTTPLSNAVTYYWKVVATNANGSAVGSDVWSFTTMDPPLTGTKTIGAGGNYTTFTAAINALNLNGVGAGGVTFNVTAGSIFAEEVPFITATGTAANPIIFQKSGAGANPEIQPATGTQGIRIVGGDYITFDGIDIRVATGQIPNYGYYVANASATNGARNNVIKNCKITLNKANTGTKGIYDYYAVTPTSLDGINANNTYQNITIENSNQGIYVYGHSTYKGFGNVIRDCTIGASTADDMGGGSSGYGIYSYYQTGAQIFNNVIRNFTCTSTAYGIYHYYGDTSSSIYSNTISAIKTSASSSSAYGIYVLTANGTVDIYKNKISSIGITSATSTSIAYGINASLSSTGTNTVNIYNNMVWDIYSSYTGSGSATYLAQGIYLGGATAANTYNVDYNSVRVVGPATSYSAGVYFAANTAVNKLRNNVIVNNTPNQTGSYYHTCVYYSNATTMGAATSVANNNVLYYTNANNGLVVRGSTTNYANIQAWTTASTQDGDSRPTDPQIDVANPLNILTSVPTPVESKGMVLGITTDIYGTIRNATTPDIGAHEGNFILESFCETPTAQPTGLVLIPSSTSISGSFTAASANAYLVVGHQDPTLSFSPIDGTYYSAGQVINTTEVIVSASAATSFTATGLTANTQYYTTIFAFNNTGIGAPKYYVVSPLTGTMTTLPVAPAVPGTLTATAISPTQIDLVSTANAVPDNIMIARNTVNTFGTPLATGYTVGAPIVGGGTVVYMGPAGTFNDITVSGGTTYFYSAWSYISAERATYYAYSTTAKTANATTPQVPATLPFAETFEVWPNDWSVVNGTQTNKWYVGTATAFAGTKSAYISNDNGVTNAFTITTTSAVHMYRDITFAAGASEYELSLMYNCGGESTYDGLKIFLVDTTTIPAEGVQLTTGQLGSTWYNLTTGWTNIRLALDNSIAGTTKRLVISWRNDGSGGIQPALAVDNISVTAFMTPKPTALTASAITVNSAVLSWTSAASSFDLEWGASGFAQGTGTMLNSIANNYSLTSLSAQTGYSYYVRANDGINTSAWAGPYTFYTVFNVPYTTGFDATTNPAAGWWTVINSTSTSAVVNVSTTSPNSAPNSIYMYNPSSNQGALVSLVSPAFNAPLNTLYARFYARGTAGRNLIVGVVNSLSSAATFTPVTTIPLTATNAPYVVDFTPYAGSDQYISFRLDTTDTLTQNAYIDDVTISTTPWDELAITAFTTTPLYKFTGAEMTFNVTVKNNGTISTGKSIAINEGTNLITNLAVGTLAPGATANLSYVYTPAVAGTFTFTAEAPADENLTNNVATLADQTIYTAGQLAEGFEGLAFPPARWETWQGESENEWLRTTSTNYDGVAAAGLVLTATNVSSYIATPQLIFTPARNAVSFYAKSSTAGRQIQVYSGTSIDGTGYTALGTPITLTTTYAQYTVDTSALDGHYRIAFQGLPNAATGTIYIDKVVGPMIYIPAEAPGPVTLTVPANAAANVDPLTAVLQWSAVTSGGDPTGFYVRVFRDSTNYLIEDHGEATADGWWGETPANVLSYNLYSEGFMADYNTEWWWQIVPFNADEETRVSDCLPFKFTTLSTYEGNITVGTGNTYTSLTADAPNGLFKAINSGAVSGNITINISSDITETGAIALNQTNEIGTGGYTITIKPSEAVMKTISGSYSSGGLIRLNDADRVIIDGRFAGSGRYLTINNTSTTSPKAIALTRAANGARDNTIRNCILTTEDIISTISHGIHAGAQSNNLSIIDNVITRAYFGVYALGTSSNAILNLVITGNTIGDAAVLANSIGNNGIYTSYVDGFNIANNSIVNLKRGTNPKGIFLTTETKNGFVSKNVIDQIVYTGTAGYGGKGIDLSTIANSNIVIDNNMISNLSGDGWGTFTSDSIVGIRLLTPTGNVKLYYNSVYLSGNAPRSSVTNSAALYIGTPSTNLVIVNNIFMNSIQNPTTTTSKAYAIYSAAANTALTSINNNLYFTPESQGVLGFLTSDVTTLQAWRTATAQDAASMYGNPQFTSTSDLHINNLVASWSEGRGQHLAAYPTDFDGDIRWNSSGYLGSATLGTDIGADEGNFVRVPDVVTPTAQPTNLALIPGSTTVNGSFTAANPAAEAYLVVRHTVALTANPVSDNIYTVGSAVGGGTVVKVGDTTSFTTTSLTNGTAYSFTVFAYSTTGAGAPAYNVTSPLTGSVTTLGTAPLNPISLTPVAISQFQINITTVPNTAVPADNVLLAYNTTATFGIPLSNVNYAIGNEITGGGFVLANGAAGTYNHTLLNPFTTYYYKAWSVKQDGSYYLYSDGIIANAYTHATVPYTQNFDASTALPLGWSKLGSLGSFYVSTTPVNTTPNALYVAGSTTSPGCMGALPPVTASNTYAQLKFMARGSSATTGIIDVGFLNTMNDPSTFVLIQSVPISSLTYTEYSVPLGLINGTKYFALRSITNSTVMRIDDVVLSEHWTNDLAVTGLTGPSTIIAGSAAEYSVSVRNEGTAIQDNFTVKLMSVDTRAQLATIAVSGANLASGASQSYLLSWTPSSTGSVSVFGEVALTGDQNSGNNASALKQVTVYPSNTMFTTAGDPQTSSVSASIPVHYNWKNSVSETIYTGQQLQITAGMLQGIYYYSSSTALQSNKPIKIWVKNTTETSVETAFLSFADYVLVADATITIPIGQAEIFIPFSTPFAYTGNNLAMRVNRPMDTGYLSGTNFYVQTLGATEIRTRLLYSDANLIDPADPQVLDSSTYQYTYNNIPLTTFMITDATPVALAAPEVSIATTLTGVQLSWPQVVNAQAYRIYVSDDPTVFSAQTPTLVQEPTRVYNYNTTSVSKKFFKVIAISSYRNSSQKPDVLGSLNPNPIDISPLGTNKK